MAEQAPGTGTPYLLVAWSPDAAEVGWRVGNYLKKHLPGRESGEIEPLGFYPLGGVEIKGDVIGFPRSKFYAFEGGNVVLFQATQPSSRRYRFLSLVLDNAERLGSPGVYTVGGIISMIAHTDERKVLAVVNAGELKESLAGYDLDTGLDYQGATSLSGFLLWVAKQRKIPAVSFWVNVPFYLAEKTDPRANKALLHFLNCRFGLGIDLEELDREIEIQEEQIARLRKQNREVDEYIARLELNVGLTQEEVGRLVEEINRAMA
jgi:predicted ATP-grasp superfamily ATP-dependent carboligase